MVQIVPLDGTPNQTIDITLAVDGNNLPLRLGFNFNDIAGYWVMSVTNSMGVMLLSSVPLLAGVNLLGQYAYFGIGSAAIVNATGIAMDSPDMSNLGSDFLLLWGDTP